MSVYFGGSRSLPQNTHLARVVVAVLAAGESVHVGCSTGADEQVISAALRSASFQQLRVFAAFGAPVPSPSLVGWLFPGSWSGSAVRAVHAAAQAGAPVIWWAGGPLAVPMAARLIRRSQAALAGCSAAVFFAPGPGSLAVAAHALAASIPVFAFCDQAPASLPRGATGRWVSSSFFGFSCWQFAPAQQALFQPAHVERVPTHKETRQNVSIPPNPSPAHPARAPR